MHTITTYIFTFDKVSIKLRPNIIWNTSHFSQFSSIYLLYLSNNDISPRTIKLHRRINFIFAYKKKKLFLKNWKKWYVIFCNDFLFWQEKNSKCKYVFFYKHMKLYSSFLMFLTFSIFKLQNILKINLKKSIFPSKNRFEF